MERDVPSGLVSCATGEHNLALMVALLASALVARKAFCSWTCPVGAICESLGLIGRAIARMLRAEPAARRPA